MTHWEPETSGSSTRLQDFSTASSSCKGRCPSWFTCAAHSKKSPDGWGKPWGTTKLDCNMYLTWLLCVYITHVCIVLYMMSDCTKPLILQYPNVCSLRIFIDVGEVSGHHSGPTGSAAIGDIHFHQPSDGGIINRYVPACKGHGACFDGFIWCIGKVC